MHVTLFGAGALGAVYGAYLESALVKTTFLTANPRPQGARLVAEPVDFTRQSRTFAPHFATEIPAKTDVIFVTVASDAVLDVVRQIGDRDVPVLILAPLLPNLAKEVSAALGDRWVPCLPTVIAYQSPASTREQAVFRYWIPFAPTLVEADVSPPYASAVDLLCSIFERTGLPMRRVKGVVAGATGATLSTAPFMISLGISGSLDALVNDAALREHTSRAIVEAGELAGRSLGRRPAMARFVAQVVGSPLLSFAKSLVETASPETVTHLNAHFAGKKLRGQHAAFLNELKILSGSDYPTPALDKLRELLHPKGQNQAVPSEPNGELN